MGNSQMHRAVPCGGLGDAETKGRRTFVSAVQILPIGTIGSRGVREIFFSECRQDRNAGESVANQERSFCGVGKGRLVPAVVAKVAPKPRDRAQAGTVCALLGSTGRAPAMVVVPWPVRRAGTRTGTLRTGCKQEWHGGRFPSCPLGRNRSERQKSLVFQGQTQSMLIFGTAQGLREIFERQA